MSKIGLSDSIVMRELERVALKRGMVKLEPVVEVVKTASSNEVEETGDVFADTILFAEALRKEGFGVYADSLLEKIVAFQKVDAAFKTNVMYDAHKSDDYKFDAKEDDGIANQYETQKAMLQSIDSPKDKEEKLANEVEMSQRIVAMVVEAAFGHKVAADNPPNSQTLVDIFNRNKQALNDAVALSMQSLLRQKTNIYIAATTNRNPKFLAVIKAVYPTIDNDLAELDSLAADAKKAQAAGAAKPDPNTPIYVAEIQNKINTKMKNIFAMYNSKFQVLYDLVQKSLKNVIIANNVSPDAHSKFDFDGQVAKTIIDSANALYGLIKGRAYLFGNDISTVLEAIIRIKTNYPVEMSNANDLLFDGLKELVDVKPLLGALDEIVANLKNVLRQAIIKNNTNVAYEIKSSIDIAIKTKSILGGASPKEHGTISYSEVFIDLASLNGELGGAKFTQDYNSLHGVISEWLTISRELKTNWEKVANYKSNIAKRAAFDRSIFGLTPSATPTPSKPKPNSGGPTAGGQPINDKAKAIKASVAKMQELINNVLAEIKKDSPSSINVDGKWGEKTNAIINELNGILVNHKIYNLDVRPSVNANYFTEEVKTLANKNIAKLTTLATKLGVINQGNESVVYDEELSLRQKDLANLASFKEYVELNMNALQNNGILVPGQDSQKIMELAVPPQPQQVPVQPRDNRALASHKNDISRFAQELGGEPWTVAEWRNILNSLKTRAADLYNNVINELRDPNIASLSKVDAKSKRDLIRLYHGQLGRLLRNVESLAKATGKKLDTEKLVIPTTGGSGGSRNRGNRGVGEGLEFGEGSGSNDDMFEELRKYPFAVNRQPRQVIMIDKLLEAFGLFGAEGFDFTPIDKNRGIKLNYSAWSRNNGHRALEDIKLVPDPGSYAAAVKDAVAAILRTYNDEGGGDNYDRSQQEVATKIVNTVGSVLKLVPDQRRFQGNSAQTQGVPQQQQVTNADPKIRWQQAKGTTDGSKIANDLVQFGFVFDNRNNRFLLSKSNSHISIDANNGNVFVWNGSQWIYKDHFYNFIGVQHIAQLIA